MKYKYNKLVASQDFSMGDEGGGMGLGSEPQPPEVRESGQFLQFFKKITHFYAISTKIVILKQNLLIKSI